MNTLPRTPEQLATLPNARLVRRFDAVRRVWQRTKSSNTAERCWLRLSVIATAARMQDANSATS